MITLYAACLRRLGLSLEDAGVVHARYGQAVRPDTIASWSSGRREPPIGAFDDFRRYAQDQRGRFGCEPIDTPTAIHLGENITESDAALAGYPSANAMLVALAGRYLDR